MTPGQIARFWDRAALDDGCWEWQGAIGWGGYGRYSVDDHTYFAHRLAYALIYGPIPPGLQVCHRCDNPTCVKPGHLFLGTQADNIQDCIRKGRANRGHKPVIVNSPEAVAS